VLVVVVVVFAALALDGALLEGPLVEEAAAVVVVTVVGVLFEPLVEFSDAVELLAWGGLLLLVTVGLDCWDARLVVDACCFACVCD